MGRYTSVALWHGNLSYLPSFPYHSSSPGLASTLTKQIIHFLKYFVKKLVHVLHFQNVFFSMIYNSLLIYYCHMNIDIFSDYI